jgi:hypothetical protein
MDMDSTLIHVMDTTRLLLLLLLLLLLASPLPTKHLRRH